MRPDDRLAGRKPEEGTIVAGDAQHDQTAGMRDRRGDGAAGQLMIVADLDLRDRVFTSEMEEAREITGLERRVSAEEPCRGAT